MRSLTICRLLFRILDGSVNRHKKGAKKNHHLFLPYYTLQKTETLELQNLFFFLRDSNLSRPIIQKLIICVSGASGAAYEYLRQICRLLRALCITLTNNGCKTLLYNCRYLDLFQSNS